MTVTAGKERPRTASARSLTAIVDFAVELACARGRRAARGRAAVLPAGILQHSADRPRRGAFRPGHQADGGERRLYRHPLPGRGPLQEAGRHLLAAGGRGEGGERARAFRSARHHHLALSRSLADRRDRRGAADLLGGARLRPATRRRARRLDDGELRAARRRAAHRQDRRDAADDGGRRHGRNGARLSSERTRAAGCVRSVAGCRRCSGPRWPPACCSRGR